MTVPSPVPADHHRGGHDGRPAAVIGGLALTQTIGYGTLHYAFAVLLAVAAAAIAA